MNDTYLDQLDDREIALILSYSNNITMICKIFKKNYCVDNNLWEFIFKIKYPYIYNEHLLSIKPCDFKLDWYQLVLYINWLDGFYVHDNKLLDFITNINNDDIMKFYTINTNNLMFIYRLKFKHTFPHFFNIITFCPNWSDIYFNTKNLIANAKITEGNGGLTANQLQKISNFILTGKWVGGKLYNLEIIPTDILFYIITNNDYYISDDTELLSLIIRFSNNNIYFDKLIKLLLNKIDIHNIINIIPKDIKYSKLRERLFRLFNLN